MATAIRNVADTAFWVAHHRALESARRDALFSDPFAAELAGERGREMSARVPTSGIVAWNVAIRTVIIDAFITQAIAAGVDTVLNLGAGLDARPYRMPLPSSLLWIEADYAQTNDYKARILEPHAPRCRLERVSVDLADDAARRRLLASVDARAARLLILTEGVVPYLSNDAVGTLADDLHALEHVHGWIVDYFSKQAIEFRRKKPVRTAMQNAPFLFEPDDWVRFFADHGWQVSEMRYLYEDSLRLGRPMPLPVLLRVIVRLSRLWTSAERQRELSRFAGYALLTRSAATA